MKNKKILAVLSMVAVFGMGTLTGTLCTGFTVNANSTVNLDVNGDGFVNVNDVTFLKNEVLGENAEKEIFGGITVTSLDYKPELDGLAVVINNYDDIVELSEKYNLDIMGMYDYWENPNYFLEGGEVFIFKSGSSSDKYGLNSLKADNYTITAEIGFEAGITDDVCTNLISIGYDKSDFLGENCKFSITDGISAVPFTYMTSGFSMIKDLEETVVVINSYEEGVEFFKNNPNFSVIENNFYNFSEGFFDEKSVVYIISNKNERDNYYVNSVTKENGQFIIDLDINIEKLIGFQHEDNITKALCIFCESKEISEENLIINKTENVTELIY